MYTSNIFFGDKVIIEVYGSTVNKTFTVCSQIRKKTIQYTSPPFTDTNSVICKIRRQIYMKATGIVRRVDDLGRIVIPKEI